MDRLFGFLILGCVLFTAKPSQAQAIRTQQWDGSSLDFSDLPPDALATITQRYYATAPDNVDVLIVASDFDFSLQDPIAAAVHVLIRNNTLGIGLPTTDLGQAYGSASRLSSIVAVPNIGQFAGSRQADGVGLLAHELMHRFGFHLQYRDAQGNTRNDLIGRDGSHWSAFAHTFGSFHYGAYWQPHGDGTYTARASRARLNDFDLYAMGLLNADEVNPIELLTPTTTPPFTENDVPPVGATINATTETIQISQVIAAMGPRSPAREPNHLRVGLILVHADTTPDSVAHATLEALSQNLAHEFFFLTRGRSTLEIDAPVVVSLGGVGSLANAEAYLLGRIDSRRESDSEETSIRDVAAIRDAFGGFPNRATELRQKLRERCDAFINSDDAARVVRATMQPDTPPLSSLWNLCAPTAIQRFGLTPDYQSDPFDTALLLDVYPGIVLSTLTPYVDANGLIPATEGSEGSVFVTATAVQRARRIGLDSAQLSQLSDALAATQNPDGGFGNESSTAIDTAEVLLALAGIPAFSDVINSAVTALERMQRPNGSFDDSVFTTAESLRALKATRGPDIRITNVSVAPGRTTQEMPVSLTVKFVNTGNVAAYNTGLAVKDDTGTTLSTAVSTAIQPGESVTYTFENVVSPGLVGNRTLFVEATAANDLDTSNNVGSVDVVFDALPSGPEVGLTALAATPNVITTLPQLITVTASLTNIGLSAATGTLLLRAPSGALLANVPVALAARASTTLDVPVLIDDINTLAILGEIALDPPLEDANPNNNQRSVRLSLGTQPNLVAVGLTPESGSIRAGEPTLIVTTIRNASAVATSSAIRLTRTASGNEQVIANQSIALLPGEQETLTIPWRPDVSGSVLLKLYVDPDDTVAESNEGDNSANASISVEPSSTTNLRISAATLDDPKRDIPTHVAITISNTSDVESEATHVAFKMGVLGSAQSEVQRIDLAPLAPHSESQLTLDFTPVDAGTTVFSLTVDPDEALAEYDETDNTRIETLRVADRADLSVSFSEITPTLPRANQPWTVTISVRNAGEQIAAESTLQLTRNDGHTGQSAVPALAPGESAVRSMTLPAVSEGSYAISAAVTTAPPILEIRDANNTVSRHIDVQSGRLYASDRFISPNGDGVKDSVAVNFEREGTTYVNVVGPILSGQASPRSVRTLSSDDGQVSWDGRDEYGVVAADGTYQVVLSGDADTDVVEVIVDTNRSHISEALRSNSIFTRQIVVDGTTLRATRAGRDQVAGLIESAEAQQRSNVYTAELSGETSTLAARRPSVWYTDGASVRFEDIEW